MRLRPASASKWLTKEKTGVTGSKAKRMRLREGVGRFQANPDPLLEANTHLPAIEIKDSPLKFAALCSTMRTSRSPRETERDKKKYNEKLNNQ